MTSSAIYEALRFFAESVTAKMNQITLGEPEDQLRGPFEKLMADIAAALNWKAVCTGETPLPDRLGRPDFAVHLNDMLSGYVELKAPGVGADRKRFKSHNHEQWKRFSNVPNILYTDGNEWALYRNGLSTGAIVRLSGDVATDGPKAVTTENAFAVERIIRDFLSWQPLIPTGRNGKVDLKAFAAQLAPLCRMLRDDVSEALWVANSPLGHLAKDWRQLLFPDADNDQFADAYAQTVTFALLLGRSEGADPLSFEQAQKTLMVKHSLLSRALQVLTDASVHSEMSASLNILLRFISAVPPSTLSGPEDPWLYFYEDFLAAYDPELRRNAGAYYTPLEVVRAQLRLVDSLLEKRFNRPLGFADPGVVTLDPAAGTGTYLLGVIDHALKKVEVREGRGALPGRAAAMAKNLYGLELMVGPYAVTELRVSRALMDKGAELPKDGTQVYLTDTLESPYAEPPDLGFYLKPIADQHQKALKLKNEVPVMVCIGNPPYDRHEAATGMNRARTGGWVRWGEYGDGAGSILRAFIEPATAAGHGVHIKSLYNLYVYFWRWALWKVFEQKADPGPGIVCFISASSFLGGDAFCGMRQHMRSLCDEIWVLDLGGEGRGTRKTDNVFDIQTPVAITLAMRSGEARKDQPAVVRYALFEGSREEKLKALDAIRDFSSVPWQNCPEKWQAPFLPFGKGQYFDWPLITDLMPWQHSGAECKRTWPICHDHETLKKRWSSLLCAKDKAVAFKETRDRKINSEIKSHTNSTTSLTPLNQLKTDEPAPEITRYAYRSFDRQWLFSDSRLCDYLRPSLWLAHSKKQIYLTSLFNHPLGNGPALTACAAIPDRHHLRGSYGGKDTLPLYRTADATETNILPGLLELMEGEYKRKVAPEDFVAYVYAALAHPAFTARFEKELSTCEIRIPITKDPALFESLRSVGARLLWLHTYGERFVPKNEQPGRVPNGSARCVKAVPGSPEGYPDSFLHDEKTLGLHVGEGEFGPVSREVYGFEVSGLKVVQSWLKYRMKGGAGKKSSPLDDIRPERWTSRFTTELLELLWVLEATCAAYPALADLLEQVVSGPCFKAGELPQVPEYMRKPPARPLVNDIFDGLV